MPTAALLLSIAAAFVHAGWNLLLAREGDVHSASAVAVTAGVILFAPVAAASWALEPSALPYAAAAGSLELLYLVLLATAYSVAALSFVYPVARGSAPVLVLGFSVLVLGVRLSTAVIVGVLAVAAGIVLVRGLREPARPRELGLALTIGACIAAYTLIDQRGIRHGSALAYQEVVFGLVAAGYVAGVWWRMGLGALRAAISPATIAAGAGYFGSYALTLAALAIAPAPSVAAVRESSVVIATALAAVTLREEVGWLRLGGAVLVVGGIAAIAIG